MITQNGLHQWRIFWAIVIAVGTRQRGERGLEEQENLSLSLFHLSLSIFLSLYNSVTSGELGIVTIIQWRLKCWVLSGGSNVQSLGQEYFSLRFLVRRVIAAVRMEASSSFAFHVREFTRILFDQRCAHNCVGGSNGRSCVDNSNGRSCR